MSCDITDLAILDGIEKPRPILPPDGGECEDVLARFSAEGVDLDALAVRLQEDGARAFSKSWNELMFVIASKSAILRKAS